MLCVNNYTKDYVAGCPSRMEGQLAAYKALAKSASGVAVGSFEPLFFGNLVLRLECCCFVHRAGGSEGKDGNPLNEVRMLSNSILQNGGVLTADKTIKYKPETSVLKLKIGERLN